MPKLRNGNKGDSNSGSLDCESGILQRDWLSLYGKNRSSALKMVTDINDMPFFKI